MCSKLRYLSLDFGSGKCCVDGIVSAMEIGSLQLFEWFKYNCYCRSEKENRDMQVISGALEKGCCPLLKYLFLSSIDPSYVGLYDMMRALRSGFCSHLQFLNFESVYMEYEDMMSFINVLLEGCCPELRVLMISCSHFDNLNFFKTDENMDRFKTSIIHNLRFSVCPHLYDIEFKCDFRKSDMLGYTHEMAPFDECVRSLYDLCDGSSESFCCKESSFIYLC